MGIAVRGSQAMVLAAGGYFLYKGFKKMYFENDSESVSVAIEGRKDILTKHDLYLAPNGGTDGAPGFIFGGTF